MNYAAVERHFTKLLVFSFVLLLNSATVFAVAEQDSLTLVALYNSTDGPNWTDNTNWMTENPVDMWYGVNVENDRVISLYLSQNGLAGIIPPEIGNLVYLSVLAFHYNQLHGEIPPEIGCLSRLTYLLLGENQLNGEIPPEIWMLSNLTNLDLGYNQLSGRISSDIGNLTHLVRLDLASNQFTGTIPSEIGNLFSVDYINIRSNNLSGVIPPEIGNITDLRLLDLCYNQLTGAIPPEIGNLTNMGMLRLYSNQLTSIPPEIGNMSSLEFLTIGPNQIGMIPSEIGKLSNLVSLSLEYNHISEIPHELVHIKKLNYFGINDNALTFGALAAPGIVPGSISRFQYANQDSLQAPARTYSGSDIILSVPEDHPQNQYQWFRDGGLIPGEATQELVMSPELYGAYSVKVTNPLFPALTLQTKHLIIAPPPPTQIVGVLEATTMDFIYPYAYTWDGYEYVPIHAADDTQIQPWQGFWTIVPNESYAPEGIDLLIPKSLDPPENVPSITFQPLQHYLLSFPLQSTATDLNASSLGQQLGDSQYEQTWRVGKWQWDTEGYHNYNGPDPQSDELMSLQPGKGFWLQQITDEAVTVIPGGEKVIPDAESYAVKLPKNDLDVPYTYHMVGNPYWYPIKWRDCMIRIPMTETLPTAKTAMAAEDIESWYVGLKLVADDGSARDTYNRAGVVTQGDDTYLDALDMAPMGEYVRMMLIDGDQQLAYDYRPNGLGEYTWNIVLSTSFDTVDARFILDNIANVPDGYSLVLTDNRTGTVYQIDEEYSLSVTLTEGAAQEFTLTVVTSPTVVEAGDAPDIFGIQSTVPNPFNPMTTIQYALISDADVTAHVYNVNGQLIDTLVDSAMNAGVHSIVWNAQGQASGLYFIALESNGQRDVKKVMLMK